MNISSSHKSGFTLIEILIVVAIIGLLAAIAIPNFVKSRTTSQKNACIHNLKQIDGAKATWALEQKKQGTEIPSTADLYGPTTYIRVPPLCPGGGTYSINAVDVNPSCSLVAEGHKLPE